MITKIICVTLTNISFLIDNFIKEDNKLINFKKSLMIFFLEYLLFKMMEHYKNKIILI